MASYYLKAAASYLDRSNINSTYTTLTNPNNNNTTSTTNSTNNITNNNATSNWSPPVQIGLWNIQRATHNSTNKLVSIWSTDKKLATPSNLNSISISLPATIVNVANGWSSNNQNNQNNSPLEKVIEILKKDVSSLSRLRHPCILEVVEPLEETRTSLIFATEPITGSLKDCLEKTSNSSVHRTGKSNTSYQLSTPDLDQVETQKGLLQIGKGLQFLHESAKLVHGNLTPEAIIINAKGDWKISGFGLSTYLKQPDGQDSRWIFPEYDANLPDSIQKNFDYIAPEYCLDEHLSTSNDMYSLGCILHSIHTRSGPPFQNHRSLDRFRKNIQNLAVLRAAWSRVPDDVQEVLSQLVTRSPSTRLQASNFLNSRYFSSNLLVSTLAFLDRDTFNSKQNEEHVQFMKGLLRILPQFSHKVLKQKILPSLIEESRKHILLPFLLPNIFFIAQHMDNEEFRSDLLPHIKPLFSIKDPPQNILILLDNLSILQAKATPQVFREEVMPLIYIALESDIPALQEKALKVIPGLCESLEYTHVKQVLFPKVTMVFSKTTLLSVKVNTLICFHSMVKILDKYTLTEKLVPLLARIKTKEPAVMIATLAVHEEMGKKVELNAIATLILPQLWTMSIGPLLNIDQFNRFMNSIQLLSNRVKQEHTRHLIEAKRLEETTTSRSQSSLSMNNNNIDPKNNEVNDFENLVKGTKPWSKNETNHRAIQGDYTSPSLTSSRLSITSNNWGFDDASNSIGPAIDLMNPINPSSSSSNSNSTSMHISSTTQSTNFNSGINTHNQATLTNLTHPSSSSSSTSSSNLDPWKTQPQVQPPSSSNNSGYPTLSSNSSNNFPGLPPLIPQTSSLNHYLVSNNSNSNNLTPQWKLVPPLKPPTTSTSTFTTSTSNKNNANNRSALADFDPFA